MKKSPILTVLLLAEVVGLAALIFLAQAYVKGHDRLAYQKAFIAEYERNLEALNLLLREADAYSHQNPQIDRILFAIGVKQPAGKPGTSSTPAVKR